MLHHDPDRDSGGLVCGRAATDNDYRMFRGVHQTILWKEEKRRPGTGDRECATGEAQRAPAPAPTAGAGGRGHTYPALLRYALRLFTSLSLWLPYRYPEPFCAPIQISAHTILTLYSFNSEGCTFLYINLDGAHVPISPYPVPFLCTTFYCILGSRYSTQSMQNWEYWRQWSYFETWHGHFQDKASIYHFIYNPCFICYKSSTVIWSICMDWPNLRIPPSLVSLVKIKRY